MPECNNLHINFKEVLALEPAVQQWGPLFRNKKLIVHCDNQAAVAIINRGSCHNPVVMQSLRRIFWLYVKYNFRLTASYIKGRENVLADAVSRLHESPCIVQHLKLTPVFVSPPPGMAASLEAALSRDVQQFRLQTYAPSTQRAYRCHKASYLAFCAAMGYPPVPASTTTLCKYAALLARTLKYTSIKQYLTIVRYLHLEWSLRGG